MFTHFFRSKAPQFSLTGERRFVFDDMGEQAAKIGEQLRNKQNEFKENPEKLQQIEQLKQQAHNAIRSGNQQMEVMKRFAFQTNKFLSDENVQIDGKEAKVLKAMLKEDYITTLIEKADWKAPAEKKNELPAVSKHMEANKDDLLSRQQANLDAFLKDPTGQVKNFLRSLSADPEMEEQKLGTPDATAVLLLLVDAKWITPDQKVIAEQAISKAQQEQKQKAEIKDSRLDVEKYLDGKREEMLKTLQPQFEQFLQDPAGTFEEFKNAINQKLQTYPEKSVVQAITPEGLINVLYKAHWIARRGDKEAALRKLQPAPVKVVEVRPSGSTEAAPRAPEVNVESLERDLRVLRNAPVGSPDWNKAANARMQICVMQFEGKRGVDLDDKLARMGGARTSDGFRVVDQRKMFYALRDYDVGGSLMERDMDMQDMQDSNDRSRASRTGEANKLDHKRIIWRNSERERLRMDAQKELQQVRGGERSAGNMPAQEQLWLEQFPNYTLDLEAQALRKKMDELQSNRSTNRKLLDIARQFDMSTVKFHWSKATDEMKKDMLADLRRFVLYAAQSAGEGMNVPQDTETQLEKLENRRVQMMLDSVYFDDAVYLQKAFPQVNGQDLLQLRNTFWNILRTWDDSNLLRKQQMLQEYDKLLAKMHKLGDRFGGSGMRLPHYEDAPKFGQEAAPRTVKTIPKNPNSYLAQVDTRPPAPEPIPGEVERGGPRVPTAPGAPEKETNAAKMEEEQDEKFKRLLRTEEYALNFDEWQEVWDQKTQITNTRERVEEKSTLVRRMEASKNGDLLKEVSLRQDKQALTLWLKYEDIVVIYPKADGPNSPRSIVYAPFQNKYEGEGGRDVAGKHGLWISRTTQSDSTGRELLQGITIHFTTNEPYVVEQKTQREGIHKFDMEQEALKVKEAKQDASGKFEWHTLKNGKPGFVYWFDKRTNILYGQMADGQYPQAINTKTGIRTYLTPAQMSAVAENAPDPAKEQQKLAEAKTQAVDTWNFNLNSALIDKQSGKKFGYYFDFKGGEGEGVVYATDPTRSTFYYWNEDKSDWEKILRAKISPEAQDGLQQAKVEQSRNKPRSLGGTGAKIERTVDGPKKGVEKTSSEPISKMNAVLFKFADQREKTTKAKGTPSYKQAVKAEVDLVNEMFAGDYQDIFNALNDGKDDKLSQALPKVGLPNDATYVTYLKAVFPKGYAEQLEKNME